MLMPMPTALVVDDDLQLLDLASRLLTMDGMDVLRAASAEDALAVASDAGPLDLLFTDVVLPGRSGIELALDLVAARPGLPVLLTTGEWHGEVRKAIDASALPYLLKPYGLDEVHEAIHRVLGPPPSVQP